MNLIKKMFSFIKNIFNKKEDDVKQLDSPSPVSFTQKDNRENFKKELKLNVTKSKKKKEVETPIRVGDGLGISGKLHG